LGLKMIFEQGTPMENISNILLIRLYKVLCPYGVFGHKQCL
jgi:hypothetical protein